MSELPPAADSIDRESAEAKKQRLAGHFRESILIYERVLEQTNRPGEEYRHGRALLGIAMSEMWLSQYSNAYEHFDSVRKSAKLRADHMQLAWAILDLSTLALILNDPSAAAMHAEEARSQFLVVQSKEGVARTLINLGTADFLLGKVKEGKEVFRFGVQAAEDSGNEEVQALAWEQLGISASKMGSLAEADRLLQLAASSWRRLNNPSALAALTFDLAEVRLKQGRISEAKTYLSQVTYEESKLSTGIPPFAIAHLKARLALAEGQSSLALTNLRQAAKLAVAWRSTAPPSDRLRSLVLDSLNSVLGDYIELVGQAAIATGSKSLLRESFIAQASSRALSLREHVMLSPATRRRLVSPAYMSLLEQLAHAEAQVASDSSRDRSETAQIKVRLSEMEQKTLLPISERSKGLTSLQADPDVVKRSLSKDSMLLSFYCGKTISLLWIVTNGHLSVHKLAPTPELTSAGNQALRSIQDDPTDKQGAQRRLWTLLFGLIPQDLYRQHNEWIIAADEVISRLPISALPGLDNRPLACEKSIRFAPIQLAPVSTRAVSWSPDFLGVGDPIYNWADERLASSRTLAPVHPAAGLLLLARLPASLLELRSIAQSFGVDHSVILSGANASVSAITRELVRKSFGVLHFATHFVAGDPSEGALLVLSIKGAVPEILTPELAATLPVGGALVVLDGCESGADLTISLESILGQARGWLIAGSPAVVTTLWPIEDAGAFFQSFYRHLKLARSGTMPERSAAALQEAQEELILQGRPPQEWAAYKVFAVN